MNILGFLIPYILKIITSNVLTPGNISMAEKAVLGFLLKELRAIEASTKDPTALAVEAMAEAFLTAAGAS